jgi:hypothetical protein
MVSFILPGNSASSDYDVDHSLRFDGGSSDYLERTPSSSGNRRTFTLSVWIKKSENGDQVIFGAGNSGSNKDQIYFRFPSDVTENTLDVLFYQSSSVALQLRTTQYFRDPSAWLHFVISIDTTQSTSSNRAKIYLNGNQITNFSTETYPSQNLESLINSTVSHKIGVDQNGSGNGMNGYFSEMVFVDGQQLDATSFGEFDSNTNIWKPKDVSGLTFGTNGFYLNVPGPSTGQNANGLGGDSSGNGNHFASSGLSAEDRSTDTCTNNFATMNPLANFRQQSTFSEGNLKLVTASSPYSYNIGTFGVASGKWYWEIKYVSATGDPHNLGHFGISGKGEPDASNHILGYYSTDYGITNNELYNNNSATSSSVYAISIGDTLGFALDLDSGTNTLKFYRNGSEKVTTNISSSPESGFYFPAVGFAYSAGSGTFELNFGSPPYSISSGNADGNGYGNFEYSVPSGYYSLCTKNLAEYG